MRPILGLSGYKANSAEAYLDLLIGFLVNGHAKGCLSAPKGFGNATYILSGHPEHRLTLKYCKCCGCISNVSLFCFHFCFALPIACHAKV